MTSPLCHNEIKHVTLENIQIVIHMGLMTLPNDPKINKSKPGKNFYSQSFFLNIV